MIKPGFTVTAAGAILAGIVSACGTTATTRTTPVPATSAHTTVPVTGSATPTTPAPAPAPTVGPGQSASIVMKVTSDVGTTGYDSVTWDVKTVKRASTVQLAGQGINTCPTGNTNNNTTVYPLGGTAPSGPDAGSASWCPNPDYQFTAVYITITNNGAAPGTKPAVNQSTGRVAGPDLSAPGLYWVTGNGYASSIDTTSQQGDAGIAVANALGIPTSNDLGGSMSVLDTGASQSGVYTPSVGAGPGQLQARDAAGHVLLVIPVP